jgi:hypothetical protein
MIFFRKEEKLSLKKSKRKLTNKINSEFSPFSSQAEQTNALLSLLKDIPKPQIIKKSPSTMILTSLKKTI